MKLATKAITVTLALALMAGDAFTEQLYCEEENMPMNLKLCTLESGRFRIMNYEL